MGFFNALKRIAQGKPVFQVEDQKMASGQPELGQLTEGTTQPHMATAAVVNGPKILPQMYIEEIEYKETGSHMECEAKIKNHSHDRLELEKIEIMGTTREFNQFIEPESEYEVNLYNGHKPQNDHDHECRVFYKNAAGDYFCSVHYVEYQKQADGSFGIYRVTFRPPIRDV